MAPLGKLCGEGQWSSYFQDPTGRSVAYHTYLQPDPKRPFTVAAVVAMDLANTRLHFLLGSQEPKPSLSEDYAAEIDRSGRIPAGDLKPGALLALALALQADGAHQAIQMDINDYCVHFDAFQEIDGELQALGLLDEMQRQDDQRYLKSSIRDFFFLTIRP